MAISFSKRELQKKKLEKREQKKNRKEERKANGGSTSFEDMIAYVDENGVIVDTPSVKDTSKNIEIEDIAISTPKKEEESILKGFVDFFNPDKGFGFIKHSSSVYKYFFHISNAPATIKEGQNVTFQLEDTEKGANAVNIEITN